MPSPPKAEAPVEKVFVEKTGQYLLEAQDTHRLVTDGLEKPKQPVALVGRRREVEVEVRVRELVEVPGPPALAGVAPLVFRA